MDGETVVERVCRRLDIDMDDITDEEYDEATNLADEWLDNAVDFCIDEQGAKDLASELNLSKFIPNKEVKQ